MSFHALVVDDDPGIREDVQDRLESLGHTCDLAGSQQEARALLPENRYAYVLLDLEIPVKYGRPSRVVNGKNLLRTIRDTKGFEDIPIIVMTSHGHDSPLLAVDVMSNGGAVNYVMKPFPESGPTLEKAIRNALRSRPGAKSHSEAVADPGPPQPFEEGELVFSETRVELCGVKICDGDGLIRAILDVLRGRDSSGVLVCLSGEELAQRVGDGMIGQNDIADAVRRLRDHPTRTSFPGSLVDTQASTFRLRRTYSQQRSAAPSEHRSITGRSNDGHDHDRSFGPFTIG